MLEPAISPRRRRLTWRAVACVIVFGCGVLAARSLLDRPAAVYIAIPAPPAVIAIPAPPVIVVLPAPASPPSPAPSPPPPPVLEAHAGCGADVATIGVPIAQAPAADPDAPPIDEVAVSREGCTIAARTSAGIAVSFDGGRSFARSEMPDTTQMAAAGGRVMLLGHSRLGTMLPGQPTVWREVPAALPDPKLFAAGKWTVLASAKLAGFSDDHGESWQYLEPPADFAVARLDADGHLHGTRWKAIVEANGFGPGEYTSTRYVTDFVHPRWRALDTNPGTPVEESGRYVLEADQFWGCGGSQKLEIVDRGHATTIAGGLREEIAPIRLHTNAGVTFASLHDQLVRLDGAAEVTLGEIPGDLVGVDASATPIVRAESRVLRWSNVGGWRVLL
jgi:hypothetical protein